MTLICFVFIGTSVVYRRGNMHIREITSRIRVDISRRCGAKHSPLDKISKTDDFEDKCILEILTGHTIKILSHIQKVQRLVLKNFLILHFYIDFNKFCRSTLCWSRWRGSIFIRAIFPHFSKCWYFGLKYYLKMIKFEFTMLQLYIKMQK